MNSSLERSLGTLTVVIYGIGTIVGAGIFVLLGKVIGIAGAAAPAAFALAAAVAGLTGLSYAQLVARFPKSAGEAVYVQQAFSKSWLTLAVGLAVAASGMISAATIAHGFAGYFRELLAWPQLWIVVSYLLALGLIAWLGIRESAALIALIAVTSTIGLVVVGVAVVAGAPQWQMPTASYTPGAWSMVGIATGAFLAFYAFIGFEDLVNLAEEVKRPGPTLRVAIPLALVVSALLYIGLCIAALGAAPIDELANSEAPIALLLDRAGLPGHTAIVVLGMVAITNGALAQLIMSARVLYGLARQGELPQRFAHIHSGRQTPDFATIVVVLLTIVLAVSGSLLSLARGTSSLLLMVFTLVNLALLRISWRETGFSHQLLLPLLAATSCLGLLLAQLLDSFGDISAGH